MLEPRIFFCSREPPKYLLQILGAAAASSEDPTKQRKYIFDQLYSILKGKLPRGKLVYPHAFRAAVRKIFPSSEMGKYDVRQKLFWHGNAASLHTYVNIIIQFLCSKEQHGSETVTVQRLGEIMDEIAENNDGPKTKKVKKNWLC